MQNSRQLTRSVLIASNLVLLLLFHATALADKPEPEVPSGFQLIYSDIGINLYRKNYPGGNPDYIQAVDLSQGAALRLLHGEITETREGEGVYGGNDPKFKSYQIEDYWANFSADNSTAFCVSNGQFFYIREYPTRLPFPLKVDGTIISDGYGKRDYPNQKLILEIWEDRTNIRPLTRHALYSSSAPNIISGLTEDARKSPDKYLPRTFVGILDNDGNRVYESILIFSTRTARQKDAADVLRSFGADKVMMLDGGGSTQLFCKSSPIIDSDRYIPQVIGTLAGKLPSYSARLNIYPDNYNIPLGEKLQVEVNIENTGSQTWKAWQTYILINNKPWGGEEKIPIKIDVEPGDSITIRWNYYPFPDSGVYKSRWALIHGDDLSPQEEYAITFNVIHDPTDTVKPSSDTGSIQKTSVNKTSHVDIETEGVIKPVEEPDVENKVDLRYVIWVPFIIIPIAILVLISILIIRRTADGQ